MTQVMIRYATKPDAAEENRQLIEQVFAELEEKSPDNVRYLVLQLEDNTFIHFKVSSNGEDKIHELDAFKRFQDGMKARCMELPRARSANIVGNYRMLSEENHRE